jgi:oligosaccharide repeat unit polymerase
MIWAVMTTIGVTWALLSPDGLHMAFGSLASLIACLPLLRTQYHFISAWTPVALAISLAAGLRGVVQTLGWDLRLTLDYMWFLGRTPEYFTRAYVVYIIGVAAITATYLLMSYKTPIKSGSPPTRPLVYRTFTLWVIFAFAGTGFVAFILFAQGTDGFSLSTLSQKRTTIDSIELSDSYESHGELRWINGMSAIALWFAIAYFRSAPGQRFVPFFRSIVLIGLLLNALALPVYASSRSEVAYVIIVTLVVRSLVGKSTRRRGPIIATGLVLLVLLAGMTFLRATLQSNAYDEFSTDALLTSATEGTVYDRTFGDMTTSAHIISNVPGKLQYQNGATIAQWLIAPIPRSVWSEKPLIAPGPLIGQAVYGTERSGVPPGFVAEMYWNFGLGGVIVGGALLGALLNRLDTWFRLAELRVDPLLALTYAAVAFRFGLFAWSGGLGSAVYRSLSDFVLVAVASTLIAGRVALPRPAAAWVAPASVNLEQRGS